MFPAIFLMVIGIALSLISWIWFRQPGQKFWFAGPVWRASKYLRPAGARLWIAGSFISLAGVLWWLFASLSGAT